DTADRITHSVPDTKAAPGVCATHGPNRAGVTSAADRAGRRRRRPPTHRPPASLLASGGARRVRDSAPCSRPAPGPKHLEEPSSSLTLPPPFGLAAMQKS